MKHVPALVLLLAPAARADEPDLRLASSGNLGFYQADVAGRP